MIQNIGRQWLRHLVIVAAVLTYLILSVAFVVAQAPGTAKQETTAKILIEGKGIQGKKVSTNGPVARIIVDQSKAKNESQTATARTGMATVSGKMPATPLKKQRATIKKESGKIELVSVEKNDEPPVPRELMQRKSNQPEVQANRSPGNLPTFAPLQPRVMSQELKGNFGINQPRSETPRKINRTDTNAVQPVVRVSELPDAPTGNTRPQQGANHAVYYPSTSNQFPVIRVNADKAGTTGPPVRTQESDPGQNDQKFPGRDYFEQGNQQMPAPMKFPEKEIHQPYSHKDPELQRKRMVEKFLASGEFLHDGGDRNLKTVVGSDWSVRGLDTEDTIGHFDTLDGQRVVVPSNRVSIYAPRFSAVQKVGGFESANLTEHVASTRDHQSSIHSGAYQVAANSKSHLATVRNVGSKSASALQDQTRGLTVDNTTGTHDSTGSVSINRFHKFLETGFIDNTEKAFLATAMQSAITWTKDLEVKVAIKNDGVQSMHDVKKAQQTITIDPRDNKSKLRVVKMADKQSAQPGEIVEFMIRFDNVGSDLIGNVTVIDNLTGRLEYVPNSASCSLQADLITSQNDAQSTQLRWEIVKPLPIGEGGVIRFKCLVR